jgi:hypothetical protein
VKQAQIDAIIRLNTPSGPEKWIPLRYVREDQVCWFCGREIPRAKPGNRVGERGTKAWWWKEPNVYECLGCRTAAVDADLGRVAVKAPNDLFAPEGGEA